MSELLPAREPKRKLALKPYARAVAQVLRVSFRASPAAVVMKVLGSLISALLPLVTTYFAALTTTALAAAYAGDADGRPAGRSSTSSSPRRSGSSGDRSAAWTATSSSS